MRICAKCAAHLLATEFVCSRCGESVTDAIREGTGSDQPAESPPLLAPTRIPDVERPYTRRAAEWGFVLGTGVMVLLALRGLWSWLENGEPTNIVSFFVFLIASPLLGLMCALVLGALSVMCGMCESVWNARVEGRPTANPPETALAKTDSLVPLAGGRYRESTDISSSDLPKGEQLIEPERGGVVNDDHPPDVARRES
jgi:hypothetical protein